MLIQEHIIVFRNRSFTPSAAVHVSIRPPVRRSVERLRAGSGSSEGNGLGPASRGLPDTDRQTAPGPAALAKDAASGQPLNGGGQHTRGIRAASVFVS